MVKTGDIKQYGNTSWNFLTFDVFCNNCGGQIGSKAYHRNKETGEVKNYSTPNWDWEYCPFCGEPLYRK